MSKILYDAREYEEITEKKNIAIEKPEFHLSARVGWMNDPNGFSFYKGEYHLFYQYHPFDSHWGPMHWGHAVSKNLLHWTYLPIALAPDTTYDEVGCFSGSAIELPNGKHLLMYTGVSKELQPDGKTCDVQTQCIAIGDGKDYEKYSKNPVLDKNTLPLNSSKYDFRDPKIWQVSDASYRCVVGNCTKEKDGQLLLYSSQDGINWEYKKILIQNKKRFGEMWECPDFFALDGKQVLIVSPQNMLPCGFEYHSGNGTVCLIGDYDEKKEIFIEEQNQAVDYGIDFYAPQTVLTPDGRRIMIGWLQNWDTSNFHSPEQAWFGQMSLPRELSIINGRLIQRPIKELENIRKNEVRYKNINFKDIITLDKINGRKLDLELSIRPEDKTNIYNKFIINLAQNDIYQTSISFRPHESIVELDRKFSGTKKDTVHQRCILVNSKDGHLKLRIILDIFSVEVFVNDGEHVLSATIYTDKKADGISFFADGSIIMDIVKYELMVNKSSHNS